MAEKDKLKIKLKVLRQILKQTTKQNQNLVKLSDQAYIVAKTSEENIKKLKEVFQLEEQGYLNRISNLECSLEDSFEDNERLQIVISTLGGRIKVLEQTNRTNIKRFRTNYNYENSTQAISNSNSNNFSDR